MSLPATVRVKLSSEAAEGISITRVVVQDLAVRELVEHMLGITGKDEARIHELLLRGSLVSGASRFRWTGWDAGVESIRELLATFPNDDPARAFDPARCRRVVLRGGRLPVDVPREAAARKPFLRRVSFWDMLMRAAAENAPAYSHYSYRDRADCYRLELPPDTGARLRTAHILLRYTSLRERVRAADYTWAELYVER